ncbi:hypothetical protein BASA81_015908 [Batrachochytrium salamandrivorans]|nr:hypothetical protein BASA81_015908 [Batrachochytrium salamandrivorans]
MAQKFVNAIVHHLTTSFHIDHRLSTPYHPRANGLAERSVQTSCRAIRKLLEGENQEWDLYCPVVQLFMNNKVSEFHSSSPFSIMFGRKLNPFCDYQTDADFVTPDANALKERMVEMSSVLFPAIGNLSKRSVNKAQLAFIKKFGKQISKDPFPVNSSVMVVDPVCSSKNEPYYLGPFKVLRPRNFFRSLLASIGDKALEAATAEAAKIWAQTPSFSISTMEIIPKESLPVKTATEKEPAAPAVDPPSDMAAEITPAIQDDGVAPTVTPIADVEMCL